MVQKASVVLLSDTWNFHEPETECSSGMVGLEVLNDFMFIYSPVSIDSGIFRPLSNVVGKSTSSLELSSVGG